MSRSKKSGRRIGAVAVAGPAPPAPDLSGAAAIHALPATVSREALIDNGSDHRFRRLVYDLLTLSARMEAVRADLGRRMAVTGPQYSLLMAVAHLQGESGVSVGALAELMHVSSAFVASETGKLARRGMLLKRPNPRDRRGVLISLAPAGRRAIDRVSTHIRAVNDLFFDSLDATAFAALSSTAAVMVAGSRRAMAYLAAVDEDRSVNLGAAG
jgi:MarR family transcriptional regulator, organic hydroperoxide resistance regulator